MPGTRHDIVDPLGLSLDEVRRVGDRLGVREQQVDVLDTVLQGVLLNGILQGADLSGILHDTLDVAVGQRNLRAGRLGGLHAAARRGIDEGQAGEDLMGLAGEES